MKPLVWVSLALLLTNWSAWLQGQPIQLHSLRAWYRNWSSSLAENKTSTLDYSTKEVAGAACHLRWRPDAPLVFKSLTKPRKGLHMLVQIFSSLDLSYLAPKNLTSSHWVLILFWSLGSWYLQLNVLLPFLYVIYVWPPWIRPLTSTFFSLSWISSGHPGESWLLAPMTGCLWLLL